jgi:hypothetical protein
MVRLRKHRCGAIATFLMGCQALSGVDDLEFVDGEDAKAGSAGAVDAGGVGAEDGGGKGGSSGGWQGGAGGSLGGAGGIPSGGTAGAGGVAGACPQGTFECGGDCHANGPCSAGQGSCLNNGLLYCKLGGVVGCSVDPLPVICSANTQSKCDPCTTGSAVAGTRSCDAYGCAYGSCLANSGAVFSEYAPVWSHPCGIPHESAPEVNWQCRGAATETGPTCICAQRNAKLPGGTYQLSVVAGFPPIDTPMTVRVVSAAGEIASETFNVVGLQFTTHPLTFALAACTDVTIEILHTNGTYRYVINLITLQRI